MTRLEAESPGPGIRDRELEDSAQAREVSPDGRLSFCLNQKKRLSLNLSYRMVGIDSHYQCSLNLNNEYFRRKF